MEHLLSMVCTGLDTVCLLVFLDVFAARRWTGWKYWAIAAGYALVNSLWVVLNQRLLDADPAAKILVFLLLETLRGWTLYKKISALYLFLLVVIQYVLIYLLSFGFGLAAAALCGMSAAQLQGSLTSFAVCALIYYFLQICLMLGFRRLMSRRRDLRGELRLHSYQLMLCLVFPFASFFMLIILLRLTGGQDLEEPVLLICCLVIFLANAAMLFLLQRMEQAAQDNQKLLALDQQLRMQAKNIESACGLYADQRRRAHDFRAHLEVLRQLLDRQEYTAARDYLDSVSQRQTDRLFLVNCRHPILDALFNTKASEATQKEIELHFEVNDLSGLTLDAADLTVLLANLIDNAIEACEKLDRGRAIQIRALHKREVFFFSVRNTSPPVRISGDELPTTKPEPEFHGFGLANVRAILAKYGGEHVMSYDNGYFQFTGEIPLTPVS